MTGIATIAAVLLTWLSALPLHQADAVLAGRVVTADAVRAPVPRAIVTLTGGDLPTNVSAITDNDGRFMVPRLRAGRYTVTASKVAHLTIAYGATRPGRPGTPVVLADGQQRIDLTIALPRGAVISGMVRDFVGEPAINTSVTIASADLAGGLGATAGMGGRGGGAAALIDGRVVLTQTPAAGARMTVVMTDDRGVYRAYGLAPGEYTVSAAPNAADVRAALQNRRSLVGVTQISRAEMDEGLTALQQRAASTAPRSPVRSPAASDMPALTYAPIFYPGTPLAGEAERVRVEAGEERTGVDFRMDLVRTARIEGVMTSADGGPLPPHQLSISSIDSPFLSDAATQFASSTLPSNAGFRFDALPPGRYLLFARGVSPTIPHTQATQTTFPIAPPPSTHWAMADVMVNGVDVLGVVLALRPVMSVSGRVAFEATTLAPPADPGQVRVSLVRAALPSDETAFAARLSSATTPLVSGPIAADGMFRVNGILPGSYVVSASVTSATGPTGWALKSVIVAGRDVLDHPLELGTGGDVTDAVVTFSDRHSELAGRLETPAGDPATEYVVVVFPADRALWRSGSRRFRSTRPASDGRFALQDLPAGAYMIAALTDVDPNDWQAPAFLEDLIPAAVKVVVADGAKVQQDLRIVR